MPTCSWCTPRPTPAAGPRGISAFIVERGTPGFATAQKLDKLGMRGSGTCELVFDECRVPAANLLGDENGGVRVLMSGLDYERVVLAGGSLGLMAAALDVVLPYVRERTPVRPADRHLRADAGQGRRHVRRAQRRARLRLRGGARLRCAHRARRDAASCILFAAERATHAALEAIQALGGNGYINDYPAGRLLRDAKLYEIGAGTQEIRRMLIGRELFEAPRERRVRPDPDRARLPQGRRRDRRAHPGRTLREGERLPSETELARQFGVQPLDGARGAARAREPRPGRAPAGLEAHVGEPPAPARRGRGSEPRAAAARRHGARPVGGADAFSSRRSREAAARARTAADLERIAAAARGASAPPRATPSRRCSAPRRCSAASGSATHNPVLGLAQEPLLQLLEPSLRVMIDKVPQARSRIATAHRRLLDALEAR